MAPMQKKNLDIVVANDVSREGSGFDSDRNAVTILMRDEPSPIEVALSSKLKVADLILDEIVKLRRRSVSARSAEHSE